MRRTLYPFVLLAVLTQTVVGQSEFLTSLSPDLATHLNRMEPVHFGSDFVLEPQGNNLNFGLSVQRRQYSPREGKHVYVQLTFGWPLLVSRTTFSAFDRGWIFHNRERRFGALTVVYTFEHD